MLLKHKFKGEILPNDVVEETQLIGMGKRVGVESKKASEQDEDILRGLARMRKASDPRKELQDLKKTMGGFKLAYKLMTEDLYDNCRLLSIVTKPLWDWYTKQLKKAKHPRDALQYSIQMAQNWNKDEHIRQMADLLTSFAHLHGAVPVEH